MILTALLMIGTAHAAMPLAEPRILRPALEPLTECPSVSLDDPAVTRLGTPLKAFYTKEIDAGGIPILASDKVCDRSLQVAYEIVTHMLSMRPDIRANMVRGHVTVNIFDVSQRLTDLPEFRFLAGKCPESNCARKWDDICGAGAMLGNPATAMCENNLIGINDPYYRRMSVMVHEFGHGIQDVGLDAATLAAIDSAYKNAQDHGLFPLASGTGTSYQMTNHHEFFACGSEVWLSSYDPTNPNLSPDVKDRNDLRDYDPELYAIYAQIYSDDDWVWPKN